MTGVAVQLAALQLFTWTGVHYMAATPLAVECAILYNYFWHVRWTWKEREGQGSLWRFHLANGLISVLGNLLLMKLLYGWLAWPLLPANLAAIAITSMVNFFAGDRWVFNATSIESGPPRP